MPELPEVETMKRVLEPQLTGRTIRDVTVNRPEVIAHPAAETFSEILAGQTFSAMERRGKFLLFLLESGDRIVLHLRMTGCILLAPNEFPMEPHTHAVFHLDGGLELRFSDTRRFGRLWLIRAGETDTFSGIAKLGPEPFDSVLSGPYLKARLGTRKKAVKECLMDQGVLAGIGNIYSDEILFAARIHPARPARDLSPGEWERLAAAIPERLSYFIEKDRLTAEEYLETKGKEYRNGPYLQVYGHEGDPCPLCGERLCRRVIGGRSSVFCPGCQKE